MAATPRGMAATLFSNGSFELPGGGGTQYLDSSGGTSTWVTGWVHAGGTDISEFYTNYQAGWGIGAGDGELYVGFGASGGVGGSLSQTFDTEIGVVYIVNYLLTTQEYEGEGAPPTQVALVEALNGIAVLNSVTNSFNQANGIWNSGLTLSFVAASTSTTLRFTEQSTEGQLNHPISANGVNWALDAVTVDVVPEPATYSLFGLGLGAIALFRKIRRVR